VFNDQHGMPLPNKLSPLPWSMHQTSSLVYSADGWTENANGYRVEWVYACSANDAVFKVHAANWIIPCRDIVRRLAEWLESNGIKESEFDIADDAAKLWEEMIRDNKTP